MNGVERTATVSNERWKAVFENGDIPSGSHIFGIYARSADNKVIGLTTIGYTVSNDTVAPVVRLMYPSNITTLAGNTVNVSGTISDAGDFDTGPARVYVAIDDTNTAQVISNKTQWECVIYSSCDRQP